MIPHNQSNYHDLVISRCKAPGELIGFPRLEAHLRGYLVSLIGLLTR